MTKKRRMQRSYPPRKRRRMDGNAVQLNDESSDTAGMGKLNDSTAGNDYGNSSRGRPRVRSLAKYRGFSISSGLNRNAAARGACRKRKGNSSVDDSLYGSTPNHYDPPARLFGESASGQNGTFKNSIVLKGRTEHTISSSGRTVLRKDATVTDNARMKTKSQRTAVVADNSEEDVIEARDKAMCQGSPHSAKGAEQDASSNSNDPRGVHLSKRSLRPLGKRTRTFKYSYQCTLSKIEVSVLHQKQSSSKARSCLYSHNYSPIIPRASTGRLMNPLPRPFGLYGHSTSSANDAKESDAQEQQSKYRHSPCAEHTGVTNVNPHGRLLRWQTIHQENGIPLPSPMPYRPLSYMSEKLTALRPVPYRKKFPVLSRRRISSLSRTPALRGTFLYNNARSSIPPNGQRRTGRTPYTNTPPSDSTHGKAYCVENRSSSVPPRDWKRFFAESRSYLIASKTKQAPRKNPRLQDQEDAKAGEWKCESCFHINPAAAMTCDLCTAPPNDNKKIDDKDDRQFKDAARNRKVTDVNDSLSKEDTNIDHTDDLQIEELSFISSDNEEDELSGITEKDPLVVPTLAEEDKAETTGNHEASRCDNRATSKQLRDEDDLNEGRLQNRNTSPSKRTKVDCNTAEAMDIDSPDNSGQMT